MSSSTNSTKSSTETTTTGNNTSNTSNTERASNRRNDDAGRGNGGRNNGGRGGRGRGNDRRSDASSANNNVSSTNKYKGKTEALNGNCFHTHSENPKRTEFITTLEAIKMYAAKEYKTQFVHTKDSIFDKL